MSSSDADRRLRLQYPGAIYHLMSRGVQRSNIFRDTEDRSEFFERCGTIVERFGWLIYSVVQMTNHFHLLFKTPKANLCRGAQVLLGPYAQYFNRRHGRSGHVFEGRYRCRVVEDESYLWSVSRYDHLNPVPAIVAHPADWRWSSYIGYRDESKRLPWIQYDELIQAWEGAFGGSRQTYCDYVEAGLKEPSKVVLPEMRDHWIIGTESFAQKVRKLVSPASQEPMVQRVRDRPPFGLDEILHAVLAEFSVGMDVLSRKSSRHPARRILAHLAHQHSHATLREIAQTLGLAGGDSVHKAIDRIANEQSSEMKRRIQSVKDRLDRHIQ